MNNEILTKRLSIIKLLYKIGMEQSKQPDSISFFSILTFHDCIEMFLKLACEYKQIKSEKLSFIEYWDKLPLTLKESMRNLNARRVNLKHKGLIPAKIEVEASLINTMDFFDQNTKSIFDVNFSDISLIELISFENIKPLLYSAEENILKEDYESSLLNSVEAFEELLSEYKSSKIRRYKNLFNTLDKISINRSSPWSKNDTNDKRLEGVVKEINSKFDHLEKALEVISFGFDFRKYSKFKLISPEFYKEISTGKYRFHNYNNRIKFNKENSSFAIDFVIECSLKLQDFDFKNPYI